MAKVVKTPDKYPVPSNWVWVKLGDLSETKSGYPFDSKRFTVKNESAKPLIRIRDVVRGYTETYTDEECPDSYVIKNGDILIGMDGDFNVSKWQSADALLNQRVCTIKSSSKLLLDDFLFYFLPQPLRQVNDATPSVTVKHLSTSTVSKILIPVPPLAEQKRIVDTITELFADLDKAAENAQSIVDGYEIRKNAILYQAFSGDLTEEWRKANDISEQWNNCVLLDVLKDKPRNGYSPQPVNYPTKYKSMTLSATTSGTFAPEHFKYIDEEIPESSHLWMVPGDILIQRANSLEKVGTSAIYTGGYHEFIYPDLMMKLQVKDGVSAEFIAYQLKTQTVLSYFRSNATGTAGNMPKINQQVVSSAPMRIPTLDEQHEIVRILDELLGNEQRIKEAAEEMLDKIAMMKKSILADAFRGKLGTNDPADESATELLKQILI